MHFHVSVKSPLQHPTYKHNFQTRCCPSNRGETVAPTGVQNRESCRDTRLLMEQLASGRKCRRQRVWLMTFPEDCASCEGLARLPKKRKEKKSRSFSVEKRDASISRRIYFPARLFTPQKPNKSSDRMQIRNYEKRKKRKSVKRPHSLQGVCELNVDAACPWFQQSSRSLNKQHGGENGSTAPSATWAVKNNSDPNDFNLRAAGACAPTCLTREGKVCQVSWVWRRGSRNTAPVA